MVSDRDGDRVTVRWRIGGKLVGTRAGLDVRLRRAGRMHLEASANDRHGATVRAGLTVRVR